MQIGGVARDLQLAGRDRIGRIGEVDHVERIDLTERHDVGQVLDEPHGIDLLVRAESADRRDLAQLLALGTQHVHGRLALLAEAAPVVGGGRHP